MSAGEQETFGGIPAWLLADYLAGLGGQRRDGDEFVQGPGWSATLVRGVRSLDGLSIGRVTVTIEGPEAGRVMAELRKKAQRGGG